MKGSFADRANKIISKYKLRLGDDFTKEDPISKRAMEAELEQLKAEQEAVKAAQEFDEQFGQFEQFADGGDINIKKSKRGTFTKAAKKRGLGVQEFADKVMANKERYSNSMVKKANFAKNAAEWNKKADGGFLQQITNTLQQKKTGGKLPKYQYGNPLGLFTPEDVEAAMLETQRNSINDPTRYSMGEIDPRVGVDINEFNPQLQTSGQPYSRSGESTEGTPERELYNPIFGGTSIIPLATSLAGNIYSAASASPEDINFERVQPEEVSLARQREDIRRDRDVSRNIASRIGRRSGLNAGAAATTSIGALADVDRSAGRLISESRTQEELANARSREIANRLNAQISRAETMANLREKDTVASIKEQATQNILQDVGSYFTDVQKGRSSAELKNMISPTFKLYEDPEQTLFNKLMMGDRSIGRHDVSDYYTK